MTQNSQIPKTMTEEVVLILAIIFVVTIIYTTIKSIQENKKSIINSFIDEDNLKIKAALIAKLQDYEQQLAERDSYIHQKAIELHDLEDRLNKAVMEEFFNAGEINDLKKQVADLTQLNTSLQSQLHQSKLTSISVKKCPGCRRVQPLSEFGKNTNHPDGLTKWCFLCMTEGAPMPHDISGMKICEKCGQNRKKSSFYPSSRYADGLSKWCKFCLDSNNKAR